MDYEDKLITSLRYQLKMQSGFTKEKLSKIIEFETLK